MLEFKIMKQEQQREENHLKLDIEIQHIKQDFLKWSGFELIGDTIEEMQSCVKQRHWDLECELSEQADSFINRLTKFEDE